MPALDTIANPGFWSSVSRVVESQAQLHPSHWCGKPETWKVCLMKYFTLVAFVCFTGCGTNDSSTSSNGNTGSGGSTSATTKEPGTVGAPCTGDDETFANFGGYNKSDKITGYVDSECHTTACVVAGFSGRKTCPEGQTAAQIADQTASCLTPEGEKVTVVVPVQENVKTVDRHVFCSCRCDAKAIPSCTCPSDMKCVEFNPVVDLPSGKSLGGSYCVYRDTLP